MPAWLIVSFTIPPLILFGRIVYRVGFQDGYGQGLEDAHQLYTGRRKSDPAEAGKRRTL